MENNNFPQFTDKVKISESREYESDESDLYCDDVPIHAKLSSFIIPSSGNVAPSSSQMKHFETDQKIIPTLFHQDVKNNSNASIKELFNMDTKIKTVGQQEFTVYPVAQNLADIRKKNQMLRKKIEQQSKTADMVRSSVQQSNDRNGSVAVGKKSVDAGKNKSKTKKNSLDESKDNARKPGAISGKWKTQTELEIGNGKFLLQPPKLSPSQTTASSSFGSVKQVDNSSQHTTCIGTACFRCKQCHCYKFIKRCLRHSRKCLGQSKIVNGLLFGLVIFIIIAFCLALIAIPFVFLVLNLNERRSNHLSEDD